MRLRRGARLLVIASSAALGGVLVSLALAQSMSGTWLQCGDAAVSENGGPQRPDPGFEEILVVHPATGSVAWYDSTERSLTSYVRGAASSGQALRWEAVRTEPTGQCTFVSSTKHTLQRPSLRYTTENTLSMVCRDKAPLAHLTRRDAMCRPIEPLPVAARKP